MHRFFTTALFVLLSALCSIGQPITRTMVIQEIATGTWCQYCPGAANGADQLVAEGKSVAVIEYHNGDSYVNTASTARNSYYGMSSFPTAMFDGIVSSIGGALCPTGNIYSTYLTRYNQRMAVPSPLSIDISGTNSGNTYTVVLSIHKLSAISANNLRAHLVLTESEIAQSWQGCMTEVNFVERTMVPDHNGTTFSFSSGDFQVITLTFTKDASWVATHCELVAFVQDNDTKEIFNGAKVALTALPPPLSVDFTGTPTSGNEPLTVNFTGTAAGSTNYQWYCPGGNPVSSSLLNPQVVYSAGSHPVTFTAWDAATGRGNSKTRPGYINVTLVPSLQVTPSIQQATWLAGNVTYSVACNTAWSASSNQPWCTVTSGTGNGTLTATVTQNYSFTPRTATITITVAGLPPATVTLEQAEAAPPEFLFTLQNVVQTSDRTLEFDLFLQDNNPATPFELASEQAGITLNPAIYSGGTLSCSIASPVSSGLIPSQVPTTVTFTATQATLKQAGKTPPGPGNGTIIATETPGTKVIRLKLTSTVPFAENSKPDFAFNSNQTSTTYPTRVAQYISGINTQLTVQPGYNARVLENPVLNGPPVLAVTPVSQTLPSNPDTISIGITTNTAWTASSDQSWCSITPLSGFGNAQLTTTLSANESPLPRTATVTVTVNGLPASTATITQEGIPQRPVRLKVLLEGLYKGGGIMNPAFDENGAHWSSGISDLITIELHDASDYATVIHTIPDIPLDTTGAAAFSVPSSLNGYYFLTVFHRNSLPTVTATPIHFNVSQVTYDFTDLSSKAYGNNQRFMETSFYALYGGDPNQDGQIDTGDFSEVDNDASQFSTGYLVTDVNGDSFIDSADMTILDNNSSQFVSMITP